VHVQPVGLNAETTKDRHRADGERCLLTFPYIGLLRNGGQTQFEVVKEDPGIVERCNLQQKLAQLKIESEPI